MKRLLLTAVLLAGCGGGNGNEADTSTDEATDVEAEGVSLAIYALDPVSGPLEGGTTVTVTGRGFELGLTITFGDNDSTEVTYGTAESFTAVTPPGDAAGAVDVTVENPSGGASTLVGGFTYTETTTTDVGWCRVM
jgi:hypothetical protein